LLSRGVVQGARIRGRKKLPSAVKELWSLRRAEEGDYYIVRVLFLAGNLAHNPASIVEKHVVDVCHREARQRY
jgi:hypothetical protein